LPSTDKLVRTNLPPRKKVNLIREYTQIATCIILAVYVWVPVQGTMLLDGSICLVLHWPMHLPRHIWLLCTQTSVPLLFLKSHKLQNPTIFTSLSKDSITCQTKIRVVEWQWKKQDRLLAVFCLSSQFIQKLQQFTP